MLPSHLQLQYSSEQIKERTQAIAAEINLWADSDQDSILAIPILRGALFFFADLVRNVKTSVEVAPIRVWGYEANNVLNPDLRVNTEDVNFSGRRILLVDDICDTGRTLHELSRRFKADGAKEVRSAVLVKREVKGNVFLPDWACFAYPGDEWLAGFGMDDHEKYRNFPDVYIIKK